MTKLNIERKNEKMDRVKRKYSFWKSLLLVMCMGGFFVLFHVVETIPYESVNVEIENTGEKEDKAEGVEITIQKVLVDGKEYYADQIFKGWESNEKGEIYNKKASGKISNGIIPVGHNRIIIFYSNKWQGKVRITEGKSSRVENLFSDVDSGEKMIKIKNHNTIFSTIYIKQIIKWSIKTFAILFIILFTIKMIRQIRIRKSEVAFVEWIEHRLDIIFLVFVSVLAVYVRYKLLNYKTDDYMTFLKPWYDFLKKNGGIGGLKNSIGNYTEGYMLILAGLTYLPIDSLYTIKAVSVIFDFLLAILGRKIILEYYDGENKTMYANITYTLLLFAPTIIFNSAYWGQCDSIYTFFVLLSLYYTIKKKWDLVFIILGCGLAFKVQTLLVFPVFLIIYIRQKEFSLFKILLSPITYLCWSLPALLEGKSLYQIVYPLLSYGDGTTNDLTYSFNNFYTLVQTEDPEIIGYIKIAGMALTLALVALSMLVFAKKMHECSMYSVVSLALYFFMIITYFLPGMHERYLYVGDVLCIIWWILSRKKKLWYIPVGVLMFSTISYLRYITNVWPGKEWNIITEINGIVCVVYLIFMLKTLLLLYLEIIENNLIKRRV